MPSFVYVLVAQSANGRTITYVGWTTDLERRLAEHNRQDGTRGGARTTAGRQWVLVYAEKHFSRQAAMKREYALKRDHAFRTALRAP